MQLVERKQCGVLQRLDKMFLGIRESAIKPIQTNVPNLLANKYVGKLILTS
jgi:hypothetical protein